MEVHRIVPNIPTSRMEASKKFYTGLLGLQVAMDMDWIVTLASPGYPRAQVSLVKSTDTAPERHHMSLTIGVDDVDAVYSTAEALALQIIYPLTTEPWGVRRFHVVDPNGVVVNVMMHVR